MLRRVTYSNRLLLAQKMKEPTMRARVTPTPTPHPTSVPCLLEHASCSIMAPAKRRQNNVAPPAKQQQNRVTAAAK